MSLKISLYSPDTFKTGDTVQVIFEVTNQSTRAVTVLKWYTPLEGLRSDCLTVKSGKKIIPYDGIKVRRAEPTDENFITLEAGESLSAKVDLETAYALPLKGTITVSFDIARLVAIDAAKVDPGNNFAKALKQRIKKIGAVGCTFRLTRTQIKIRTLGESIRSAAKSGPTVKGTPKDPLMNGMTDAEKSKMKAAHTNGYNLTEGALNGLANDAKYKKWFGVHTPARFSKVKSVLTKVKTGLETKQFTYVNNGPHCQSNDIAYTTNGSDKIWLCKVFWTLPTNGNTSQADTVLHEHSHASASTEDHAYGTNACIQLAKDKPDEAVNNADSFAFHSNP